MSELVGSLAYKYESVPATDREEVPKSFDEFIDLIIDKEKDEYKPGGIFELRSKDGTIRYENFSAWAWSKALWWDSFSPDDTKLNFFSSASINLNYRTISLQDFITDKRFERGSEEKHVLDKDGRPRVDPRTGELMTTTLYHDNADHKKMVEKIIDEMWFFNQSRNFGVAYRLAQEQDKDLMEAFGGILSGDVFTKSNGFEVIFSLAGISGKNYLDANNSITGELAAIGENIYDKIFDLEELQKKLGKDSTLFRKDFLKASDGMLELSDEAFTKINGKVRLKGAVEEGTAKGRGTTTVRGAGTIKWNEDWYDKNTGVLKTREDGNINMDWRRGQFLDYINPYNEQNKSPFIVEELRERIRQSMVERMLESNPGLLDKESYLYKKLENGVLNNDKYKQDNYTEDQYHTQILKNIIQVLYKDATRAEAVAFTTTRWFGIAALNDTTATGFDAGTKWFQTAAYRTGQGRATTVGTDLGNPRTIGIYKRVMAAPKDGIKTNGAVGGERQTIQEVVDEIANNAFQIDREGNSKSREAAKKMRFNSAAMRTYYGNHVGRGAPVYEELATGQDFDPTEYVKWDFYKGFTADPVKLAKDMKDRIKKRRYLISGYADTDYGKDVFVYDQKLSTDVLTPAEIDKLKTELAAEQGISKEDVKLPSFRVIKGESHKLGNEMFGNQVYDRTFRDEEGNVKWDEVASRRGEMWREAWFLELAAAIAAHRDRMDLSKPVGYAQLEGFYELLSKLPADITVDENNLRNTKHRGYAFNKEMISYIRKASGTGRIKMFSIMFAMEGGKGLVKGILEALKILSKIG